LTSAVRLYCTFLKNYCFVDQELAFSSLSSHRWLCSQRCSRMRLCFSCYDLYSRGAGSLSKIGEISKARLALSSNKGTLRVHFGFPKARRSLPLGGSGKLRRARKRTVKDNADTIIREQRQRGRRRRHAELYSEPSLSLSLSLALSFVSL